MIDENEEDEQNTIEDKLSFTSPTSIRLMGSRRTHSNNPIFNDQRDNSISVSKIEEVDNDGGN